MSRDEPRSMIEDYIPVDKISYESAREKVARRRNGHLSTLHLWWARRPLAAARAAVYATFAKPAKGEDREQLPQFFAELCKWTGPILPDRPAIRKAHEVVSAAADGKRPKVLDMFAGGGAIPLEALRLGADAIAVDINPVAHLIELCTLVYPQKYGKKLREAVEKWGRWVIDRTKEEVGDLYPDIELEDVPLQNDLFRDQPSGRFLRPIAYLWTRTVPSPAPGFEEGQVPLVRQTWLRKKKGHYVALRPVVDRANLQMTFDLVESTAATEGEAIEEWGFDPAGMSVRGATTCPFSGQAVTNKEIKQFGSSDIYGEEPLAIACVEPGKRGKSYLPASKAQKWLPCSDIVQQRLDRLTEQGFTIPNEHLPPKGSLGFRVQPYGFTKWGDLHSARQLLLLLTFCQQCACAFESLFSETEDRKFSSAVASYIGLLVGRIADRGSSFCRWNNRNEKTESVFSSPTRPMIWDYSEANPFGGASGDALAQLRYILDAIDHMIDCSPSRPATVLRAKAQRLPLEGESVDSVITDPPYYDNIPYSDLSDYFYVWHKRALSGIFPNLYSSRLTPKKAEAIADSIRHDRDSTAAAEFYEGEMKSAFSEAYRLLRENGSLIVVYAHKTTLGWSTLIDSLRASGFYVSEAWPIETEKPDKAAKIETASLASSIFLVARKRARGTFGNYATEVRPEMMTIVDERVRELMAVGIAGADLVIAAVGAGLRPFTRHDIVELPNGEELRSERYLDEVQREVLESILTAVFDIDRTGVGQVDKTSRFYVLARYQYGGAQIPFGDLNVLAQGLGIELSGAGSLAEGGSRLVEIKKAKARVLDYGERGAQADLGMPSRETAAPLVDVLHRLLWLLEHDRGALRGFVLDTRAELGTLRLLANALGGRALASARGGERTEEQKAIDRLLAQWHRVIEATTAPLFHT